MFTFCMFRNREDYTLKICTDIPENEIHVK